MSNRSDRELVSTGGMDDLAQSPAEPVEGTPATSLSQASALRALPSVDRLLQDAAVAVLEAQHGREVTVEALRQSLAEARQAIRSGAPTPSPAQLLAAAAEIVQATLAPTLRPVINATGVIIHTNLGRAPLSAAARQAIEAIARGYSTLEYDLEAGTRGSRSTHAERLLCRVTHAEAGLVVNNNAAAVLLMLSALTAGRQVIISRGQLVEIGGGFRVPDVMRQSGAQLVEVGTTNRTHLRDYEAAIGPETAAILLAHPSNFRILGFTSQPELIELAELAAHHRLLLLHDLGSGALLDTAPFGLAHEPTVQESLAAGVHIVCFSGDKLLGGPQAGIIVGGADQIERMKRHPLARAVRADKLCLAGLQATLGHYLRNEATREVPVWRMIAAPAAEIQAHAGRWAMALRDRVPEVREQIDVIPGQSTVGGGSLPGATLPTWLLALSARSPDDFSARLRAGEPAIVSRIEDDRLVLDPRTVMPGEDTAVIDGLVRVLV